MSIQTILTTTITAIFLLIVFSYYYLLLFKRKKEPAAKKRFSSITIIIPAHNEEKYIAQAIESVLAADFNGKKEIIVVDDGSRDKTYEIAHAIAKKFPVKVIRTKHSGKSKSINRALRIAKGELIAIVDGDSVIHNDALVEAVKYLPPDKIAAVCATVKVKNRKAFLGIWLQMEQLYNSLLRGLFSKVNVNIVAPGPLSVYKKKCLLEIKGFETKGYSEDVDVAIRLIKAGYKVECAEKSISETNMPVDVRGFIRQRTRFSKGWINILKRHLKLNHTFMQIYTLPLALFWYFQAIIMGAITIYNLTSGYITYFVSKGVWLSLGVAYFFFEWFSIVGIIHWFIRVINGTIPLTIATTIGLSASLLVYPLYFLAIVKYDKKINFRHLIAIFFMFPFWFILMMFYIINVKEVFIKHQRNIWDK
ncbi:MAG TPA: glycosyltransferase family 2 protein [Candidatus Nanoarchaeia archaeon]|nr:glycosyltransferase family 2 protein [Candidatus Nanoarchaeia archaeon]